MTAPLDQFRLRAEAARSTFHEAATWADVVALALSLAGGEPVAVSPALASETPEVLSLLGGRALMPDADAPVSTVADAAVGIVRAELAVAESGSVLLAEDALGDRAVSMLSRTLVQVVGRDRVVESLDGVAGWLSRRGGAAGYATLVTGPSRTADIERVLTIGVQGPSAVHVVVLG